MEYIKTYWGQDGNYRVSIRTNCYTRTMDFIQDMLDILRIDHPHQKIRWKDVAVVIYNTDSFKGMMGIEYSTKHPNKTYFELDLAPCIF